MARQAVTMQRRRSTFLGVCVVDEVLHEAVVGREVGAGAVGLGGRIHITEPLHMRDPIVYCHVSTWQPSASSLFLASPLSQLSRISQCSLGCGEDMAT